MIVNEDIEKLKKYFVERGKKFTQAVQSIISWGNISDKPATFPPSSHSHVVSDISNNNFSATTDPTTGDDSADGYEAGSLWLNVTGSKVFICEDASAGAAVWIELTGGGTGSGVQNNFSATTDPAVGDDSADGYEAGSIWLNVSGSKVFICKDASAGAAVWIELTSTVKLSGDQTIAGIKTFSSFPITPSSAPTTDYQVANKKYVDDNAGSGIDINALTEKTTPANDDIFVIEDSADSYSKKKLKVSNLPTGSGNLGFWMVDAPPASPSAYDDEFDDSSFDTGLWAEMDFNNKLSVTEDESGLVVTKVSETGNILAGYYQTIPAGDFSIVMKGYHPYNVTGNYKLFGLGLFEDATDNTKKIQFISNTLGSATKVVEVILHNNYSTYTSTPATQSMVIYASILYLRLRRESTTYSFDYSQNGLEWRNLYTTSSLAFTPLHFGIVTNNNSGNDLIYKVKFFRYFNSGNPRALLKGKLV